MKSIWAFVMTAATVTVYVHVRHKEPIVTPVRHARAVVETPGPAPTPSRGIVVAPYSGSNVSERWGGDTGRPSGDKP